MDGVEKYRDWVILVADSDPAGALHTSSALQGAGFTTAEAVYSLNGIRRCIRGGMRGGGARLLLVLVTSHLLGRLDSREAKMLLALAEEAGVGVVLLSEDERAVDAGTLADAWGRGITDILPSGLDSCQFGHRILLLLSNQVKKRRLCHREQELESELAELRVMESRLQHLVYHDELTGLWNRRRIKEALELAVLRAANLHRPCALLLIDMDRFKLVNDLEGYDAGDKFLIEVSRLLRRHAGEADTVARIGSDEFAILIENVGNEASTERAEEIRKELELYRFRYGGRYYRTCASIGVAYLTAGERGICTSELMAQADQACFVAKQHGRNHVHCYSDQDPELEHLRRDHSWAPKIREAIENDRFFFCFQPIVRVLDGRITHYECLLRMRDRNGRIYMPGEFIPVAERTGLIHHVDMWVVDRALDFLTALPQDSTRTGASINLSAHAFRNRDLFDLLARRLEMSWVSPTRLVFELTETAAIENMDRSRELVARLRALGCRFALDDFGSGFSTFNYIKNFPVDFLKLDGSFIVNLANDPLDQELVRHMISIARSLGKETVAEFVESQAVFETLRRLGVDYVQGHYLGEATEKPVNSVEVPPVRSREKREEIALLLGQNGNTGVE